jgi:hypothetical protein
MKQKKLNFSQIKKSLVKMYLKIFNPKDSGLYSQKKVSVIIIIIIGLAEKKETNTNCRKFVGVSAVTQCHF